MRQYEKKGIFTIKQLSYLFKPRKRKKGSRKPPPVAHKVELQALAIREKKIYLQELPALSRQPVELFVDMEGVPDRGLYYLIGVLVCHGDTTERTRSQGKVGGGMLFFSRARRDRADDPGRSW
jgi:predicted RecB family nuclease